MPIDKGTVIKGTVTVTGGAGFIGSHTAVELASAGYDLVIVDNFSNSERFILEHIGQIIGRPVRRYELDAAIRPHFAMYSNQSRTCRQPSISQRSSLSGKLSRTQSPTTGIT